MTITKTLCLNMIVKNETKNLERCLGSVADHISCWFIGDTGSTDGTQDFIKSFFAAREIPGELHSFPFHNWEQARNAALDCAYASPLAFDYLLFADADMELVVEDRKFREELDAPGYRLIQRADSGLVYWNARLVQRNIGARYHGVTHEYLDVPGGAQELRGVWYKDHASGSNRGDKFERDIRLLSQALEKEPENVRYWYYLAQSYRDAGQTEKAAKAYAKRAGMGGWEEEAWSARLQEARCLRQLGDEGGFLRQALAAFNQRPRRAEPLYDLARFYREKGMNDASLLFSEPGLTMPRPDEDILFIEDFVYKAGFQEEFSIAANYARDPVRKDRGFAACNWLALNRDVPQGPRELALSNLYFYIRPVKEVMPSFVARPVAFKPPDGYRSTNPSVARSGDKIVMVQRAVNYNIDPAFPEGDDRRFATPDGAPIETRNFLLLLDGDMAIRSSTEILPPENMPKPAWPLVRGFEDMRPFAWRDRLWCVACVRELSLEGWCDLVLARIDERAAEPTRLADWRVLRPAGPRRHEKNWMPQVVGDALQFIYLCDPTRLVDDQARTVAETIPPIAAEQFRGGSQLIAFDGGWLALVHEARVRDNQRNYKHRFVWFDEVSRLRRLSRPFYFAKRAIEFASGMAWHPNGRRLIISYGVDDSEAWIATVDADDVRRVLEDAERLPSAKLGTAVGAPVRQTASDAATPMVAPATVGNPIATAAEKRQSIAIDGERSAQSLASIFRRWGTDKVTNGYADLYECLFHKDRDRVELVLEIGIGTMLPGVHSSMVGYASPGYRPGGSLRSWRDFFPNATIYGVDVQPDTQFDDEERIVTFLCDSTDRSEVERLMGRLNGKQFDIALDDGSHRLEDQIATLQNLYPFVKEGGAYVVEDVVNGALVHHQDKIKAVCGDDPFFFHGARNNPLVITKRPRARPREASIAQGVETRASVAKDAEGSLFGAPGPADLAAKPFQTQADLGSPVLIEAGSILAAMGEQARDATRVFSNRIGRLDGTIVETVINGRNIGFFVTNRYDAIMKYHYDGSFYESEELEIIRRHCTGKGAFVDIGANIGNHAIFISKFTNAPKIILFEPNQYTVSILKQNLLLNQCDRVDTRFLGIALAARKGMFKEVTPDADNLGHTCYFEDQSGSVSAFSGDELLLDEPIDFVKLDVEGMEIEILSGLEQTIGRWRPTIFIEVWNSKLQAFRDWCERHSYQQVERYQRYDGIQNYLMSSIATVGLEQGDRPSEQLNDCGPAAQPLKATITMDGPVAACTLEDRFLDLAPFLRAVDTPSDRRNASRPFDAGLVRLLSHADAAGLPQIHCFYEVMSDSADHRTLAAAMKSMRAAGHPVRVWTYSPQKLDFLAAAGVEVRQATDVVPTGLYDRIVAASEIRYFSDVFRYAVLYEHGGLWMDCDMILLRPFPYRGGHFLNLQWRGGHKGHFICGNVMGAPPFSRHMRALYEASIDRFFAAKGWEFGLIGPKLLSDYVASEAGAEARDRLFSPMLFNAIDWMEIDRFDKPVSALAEYLNDDRLFGIHLWTARNVAKSGGEGAPLISVLTEPGGLPNFADLADRFNTDKNRLTGNRHCYARIYDRLLSSRRFSMRRLMEIGLCRGLAEGNQSETPSVALWQTYFPFCQVVGVDLTDFSRLNNERFTSFVCDQSKVDDLRAVAAKFEPGSLDVIIDDGSHASADQQLTLREFFPLLADGGWFFIEDLDWQSPGEDPSKITLTKTLLREIRDFNAPRSIDPLGIGALTPQFAEILFFDSHYELTRAKLMGGLAAIRKGRGDR